MINVTINGPNEIVAEFTDAPKAVSSAAVRALNRALTTGRALIAKNIAADTGLRSGDIKNAVTTQKATRGRELVVLGASLKRLPLSSFRAKQTKKGVSYKNPGGGRSSVDSAFIATMKTGHQGVFMRRMKARLPIKELYGPSLGHVFAKYRAAAAAEMETAFHANFAHELDFATSQQGGGSNV